MKEVEINKEMRLSEHLASPSEAALSHLSELNGLRLSPHFTLGELCKTSHQTKDGNIPSRVVIENLRNICENWLEDLRYSYNTLYQPPVTSSVPIVTSSDPSVISSEVERSSSARLLPEGRKKSREISPCASLSRDDKEGCRDDKPIIINSGYRSPEVNRLAGGSPTSNHLTGCAVDIHVADFEQAIRYASILLDISDGSNQNYDELYIERNSAGRYWIHFAVRPKDRSATQGDACLSKNRRKMAFLKA